MSDGMVLRDMRDRFEVLAEAVMTIPTGTDGTGTDTRVVNSLLMLIGEAKETNARLASIAAALDALEVRT